MREKLISGWVHRDALHCGGRRTLAVLSLSDRHRADTAPFPLLCTFCFRSCRKSRRQRAVLDTAFSHPALGGALLQDAAARALRIEELERQLREEKALMERERQLEEATRIAQKKSQLKVEQQAAAAAARCAAVDGGPDGAIAGPSASPPSSSAAALRNPWQMGGHSGLPPVGGGSWRTTTGAAALGKLFVPQVAAAAHGTHQKIDKA